MLFYAVLEPRLCFLISSLSLSILHLRMYLYSYLYLMLSYLGIDPKFLNDVSAFNAHALGALADVAGPGLDFHLSTILPALLAAMDDADEVYLFAYCVQPFSYICHPPDKLLYFYACVSSLFFFHSLIIDL